MAHRYPRYRFRDTEPPDPDKLTELVVPLADKLGASINEQDLSTAQGAVPLSKVQDEAYYQAVLYQIGADPNFGPFAAGSLDLYASYAAAVDSISVIDSPSWQPLVSNTTGTEFALSVTTGYDQLFIIGWGQVFCWIDDPALPNAITYESVRLQCALRVDGLVEDDTITGAAIYPDPPMQELYKAERAEGVVDPDFDYRHVSYVQNTVGMNNAVHPFRMVTLVPVNAGAHTVAVTARRIPRSDGKKGHDDHGEEVKILNRLLLAVRIKGFSAGDGGVPSIDVSGFEDGDTLSQTALFTNRLNRVRTNMNDLSGPEMERGAFRSQMLPSVAEDPDIVTLEEDNPVAWGGIWPGYGVDGAGWATVQDVHGNLLKATKSGAGWNFTAKDGIFVILANVEVPRIHVPAGGVENYYDIAVLTLAYTDGAGTRHLLSGSESMVNAHVPDEGTDVALLPIDDMLAIDFDHPLAWVLNTRNLANKVISNVEVLVSVSSIDGAEVSTQRAILTAFFLRGLAV